ncbi:DUF5666 domain-containing protein [Leifsonia shinshuensis]|uniref:DUF5666 domain-containing protein n=1 Tax=Leifsonia shinshuensis TaxID=150026 RepID=A0A7G6Y8T7_9MICO|nr:DUF5666 domain-containing protein [Leifsonia shinshuensis]QNE34902.1 hypothetical protein F1C12_07015 [Leifsonia shinshuensis]
MNRDDNENDSAAEAANDTENAANGVVSGPGEGRELPTEPLPWWVEGHGAEGRDGAAGDTVPLAHVDSGAGAAPGAGAALGSGAAYGAGAAPASGAGMAVTDSMKGDDQPRSSFLRRHAVGLSIAAAALAIVVVAGGTAWGVSAAVAGGGSAAPAAMNTAVHAKKGASAAKQKHSHGTVGTVTAMSGGTWTIQSAAGTPITVNVGSATAFGTAKKPATESSFAVGDRVGVLGTRSGDSVTATRIVHLGASKQGGMSTPAPTPNT